MRKELAAWTAEKLTGPSKRMRASQFEQHAIEPGDVVFLGDSITEGGLWNEWFPGLPVKNRGIGGDSTAGVLARLATAATNEPAAVFVLIGTNDIVLGIDDDEIVGNIREILATIAMQSPTTKLFLQSIMPRKAKLAPRLRALNVRLAQAAREAGATWIDLWPRLAGPDGAIVDGTSLDSLHLNGDGYAAWVEVLRPHVASVGTLRR